MAKARNIARYLKWSCLLEHCCLSLLPTEAGYKAIMESGELFASTGVKNARHGAGQYFTDLTSGYTSGQISRCLFGVPWNSKKLSHFIDVDMSGLNVIKNAPHNFLVPGTNSLSLNGRIINHGTSIFK